jgi:NADH-ubiquinone oxidoreductase chain 3
MFIAIITLTVSIGISIVLILLAIVVGKKSLIRREKLSPFECGFDPFKKARTPFSLRFFLITILFLIFDVEVALLLPLALLLICSEPYIIIMTATILILILILGLFHEWNQGALA